MPSVFVETGYLKELLAITEKLPPHNWLISGLECYDNEGWEGCEKWAKTELFLSDDVLRHDVNLRNMQFIWGVFSMIPAQYSLDEVLTYPLPETETPYYLSNKILPQHLLATLEIYVEDGCFTFVSAHDASLLAPFYELPYKTYDLEAENQSMNAQLRRIQDVLHTEIPDVSEEFADRVQWKVWHSLFKDKEDTVTDRRLRSAVRKAHASATRKVRMERLFKLNLNRDPWDPYSQE